MNTETALPISMQIVLLRHKMALQRQLIAQKTSAPAKDTDQFPRSFGMKLLQQQLSGGAPWLMALKNKLDSKESALLWSIAFSLGQHWLQKK
jgi:hypothetical protein